MNIPPGYKLLKDSTYEERSFPEDVEVYAKSVSEVEEF